MPLVHGDSPAAFSRNVAAEVAAGKPQAQAVAIAYREARGAALRKVAKAARVHHKIDLSNVMLDSWPAALDEGGAPELAEQVRNVLARGPAGKKRKSVSTMNENGLTYDQWLAAAAARNSTSARKAWKDGEDPSDYRAGSTNKPARKPSASKEEREAKRRSERREAEDKLDALRKERDALTERRTEADRERNHQAKKVRDLDGEIKKKGREIVTQANKLVRLSR